MIRITSKRDGFYRGGVPHPAQPTDYRDGHFSDEQLAAIEDEAMLTVQHIAGDPENAPEGAAPAAPGSVTVEIGGVPVVVTPQNLSEFAEQILERTEKLEGWEKALDTREATAGDREKELDGRAAELSGRKKEADKRAADLDKRDKALAEKAAKAGKK